MKGAAFVIGPAPTGLTANTSVTSGQRASDQIENNTVQWTARVGADDLRGKITKEYPPSFHAHTTEERLADRKSLNRLFVSIEGNWLNGRAGSIKP